MPTLRALLLAGLVASVLLGTGVPATADPSSAGCNGFTGRWVTTWPGGTATLRITGTTGSYDYNGGTITGRLDDNVLTGSYAENNDATGTFWFRLLPDGNSFKGWYATAAAPDRHLYWRGICLGAN